jgi:hypothetical protein
MLQGCFQGCALEGPARKRTATAVGEKSGYFSCSWNAQRDRLHLTTAENGCMTVSYSSVTARVLSAVIQETGHISVYSCTNTERLYVIRSRQVC